MKIVVFLGNIGKKYENTFHNVGFMVADKCALNNGFEFDKKTTKCVYSNLKNSGITYAKPTTFMNLSGVAVAQLMQRFKCKPEDVLVVYDDYDLPLGKIRFRSEGSGGTHNGARSIVDHIGQKFQRIRVGIKPEIEEMEIIDYVLSQISKEHQALLNAAIDDALKVVDDFVNNKL